MKLRSTNDHYIKSNVLSQCYASALAVVMKHLHEESCTAEPFHELQSMESVPALTPNELYTVLEAAGLCSDGGF